MSIILSHHKRRVYLINLLFYSLFNLISFKISVECAANSQISFNETFQVFIKNISDNYSEILFDNDNNNEEFAVMVDAKNITLFGDSASDVKRIVVPKCCDLNEIYAEKVCREKNASSGKFVTSQSNFQLCDADEVIVEYKIHEIKGQEDSKNFCVDFNENFDLIKRVCKPKSICDTLPCVRKCCKGGEKLQVKNGTSKCVPFKGHISPIFHKIHQWPPVKKSLEQSFPVFGVLQGQSCSKFVLDSSEDQYYLSDVDGSLYINGSELTFGNHQYCTEIVDYGDNFSALEMFVCFEQEIEPRDRLSRIIGFCFSVLGFILTLLVYIFVLKLRNTVNKIVICYCSSFLLAYLALLVTQFLYAFSILCKPFAYLIYFSFISGFTWLQIMCFDIWLKFSSTRRPANKKSKRFFHYFLYATFLPSFLLILVAIFQHVNILPQNFRPSLGEDYCWFTKGTAPFTLFFLLPVLTMLFVLTMIHCNKIKMEIARVQRSSVKRKKSRMFVINRAILSMNAKLFTIMGLSWFLEIVSSIFINDRIWWIIDFYNSMLGVFVFGIFVLKKRVINKIKAKFGMKVPDNPLETRTMSTTASNRNRIVIINKKSP